MFLWNQSVFDSEGFRKSEIYALILVLWSMTLSGDVSGLLAHSKTNLGFDSYFFPLRANPGHLDGVEHRSARVVT